MERKSVTKNEVDRLIELMRLLIVTYPNHTFTDPVHELAQFIYIGDNFITRLKIQLFHFRTVIDDPALEEINSIVDTIIKRRSDKKLLKKQAPRFE